MAKTKQPKPKPTMTVVVQIGNSDDKLTQREWVQFIMDTRSLVNSLAQIHFSGGSSPTAVWQNYCIVAEARSLNDLRSRLADLATRYRQDSIALTLGKTEFVRPAGWLPPGKRGY